jgi:hypothetical protein
MHPPGTSSLETRATSQRSPQLHHRTRDFVAYRCLTLVVVYWRRMDWTGVAATSRGCLCGGSSSGSAL